MSWQDQGRQQHGWFGHGTSGAGPASAERAVVSAVAYGAYGFLPAGQRAGYERWLDHGGVQQIAAVLPGWEAGAHLPEERFRRVMFGPQVAEDVAGHAHGVGLALVLAGAGEKAGVVAAGRRFARLVTAAGPEMLGRVMADATVQAGGGAVRDLVEGTVDKGGDAAPRGDTVPVGLKCEGVASGCQNRGSYGTSAMYDAFGRKLCRDCAVKSLGLEDESPAEQMKVLKRNLIKA